jgi:regulatory protein
MVGGRPAWTVPADVVAALGLVAGAPLPAGAVPRLDQAADEEAAFRSALRALERRAHGGQELSRKLHRKGHGPEATEGAVARLQRLGLLDDSAFAASYVASRARQGRGPTRLRHDLARLGVAPEVVRDALASLEAEDAPDPLARTLAQAERRATAMRSLPRETQRRRLLAFFARRGWSGYDANQHVSRLVGED